LFPADILGLEPVGFLGVLLSAPLQVFLFLDLHHLLNVRVQLTNKMGLKKNCNLCFLAVYAESLLISGIIVF
jgi:hypothetical protein